MNPRHLPLFEHDVLDRSNRVINGSHAEALAVLWTGAPDVVLSHESVLEAYELSNVLPHKIHVTVAKRRRIRRQGSDIKVHYQDLTPAQIGWWQGIPAVTVPTAIGQCIESGLPTYLLRQSADQELGRGLISAVERKQLSELLEGRSK